MTYTLHYSPDSANIVVRTVLEELQLPYVDELVDRGLGEQRSAAFLALNPQGLLPVLLTPEQDAPMFETAAILLYLADRHGALMPADARQRGRGLKWLFFLSNTLHADLRIMFYTQRYVADAAAVPAVRQGVLQRLAKHFALLDAEIARNGGPWLLGDAPSVCDIYLAYCARWAQLYPAGHALGPALFAALPYLQAMLLALEQRPAVQRACAREEIADRPFTRPAVPVPTRGAVSG